MKNEKWKMKNEKWKMKNEKWKVKSEKWKVKSEKWKNKYKARGKWKVINLFLPDNKNRQQPNT